MSSAIVTTARAFSLVPDSFERAKELAEIIAKSDFAPKGYQGKPGNVLIAVQMGSDLGLAPMQSLQSIAVINGKPSIYGDAALALVMRSGELVSIEEMCEANVATCAVQRKGQKQVVRTFSEQDARTARLWGKDGPWTNYPKRMLQARARAFALRDSFADVLLGIGLAEESQDIDPVTVIASASPGPETLIVVPVVKATPSPVVNTPADSPAPAPAVAEPAVAPVSAAVPPEPVPASTQASTPQAGGDPAPVPPVVDSARPAFTADERFTVASVQVPKGSKIPPAWWGVVFDDGTYAQVKDPSVHAALETLAGTGVVVRLEGTRIEHKVPRLITLVTEDTPAPAAMPTEGEVF